MRRWRVSKKLAEDVKTETKWRDNDEFKSEKKGVKKKLTMVKEKSNLLYHMLQISSELIAKNRPSSQMGLRTR